MADNVTGNDLKSAKAAIKAALVGVLGSGYNIHTRRRFVANRTAFANKYGVTVAGQTAKQIRFFELEFLRWIDSPDEGFEDCPVMAGVFNLHGFTEFLDGGEDDQTGDVDVHSEDVHNAALMAVRDFFLEVQDWTVGKWAVTTDPLVMPENTGFGNDVFTDAAGHFSDLQLTLNFYDQE